MIICEKCRKVICKGTSLRKHIALCIDCHKELKEEIKILKQLGDKK